MTQRPLWARLAGPGIRAAAEAIFPKNDLGVPDYEETDLPRRTLEYLAALPPWQRMLITLLYVAAQPAPIVFLSAPLPLSMLSVEARTRAIRKWRRSIFFFNRMLGDALKATLTMIYMSHPAVMKYLDVYKTCERPEDPFPMEVRKDALARVTP